MDKLRLSHYERLDRFIKKRIAEDVYPEPPDWFHTKITKEMIDRLNQVYPLLGKKVLDCGCGQGPALEIFRDLGATPIGTTFGEDYQECKNKGFEVYEMDQSFLDFEKETFDLVWCRHALEHSLMPLFTLSGFYDVLKRGGWLYVEVPAPDTSCKHEENKNHYSCFSKNAWLSLFQRSGFDLLNSMDIDFKTVSGGTDTYHAFFLRKK
jgi:SAM-dependent methyltransferase